LALPSPEVSTAASKPSDCVRMLSFPAFNLTKTYHCLILVSKPQIVAGIQSLVPEQRTVQCLDLFVLGSTRVVDHPHLHLISDVGQGCLRRRQDSRAQML
jgi:hypothetical protein